MAQWIRNEKIEDGYESLHNFKPTIYKEMPSERAINKIKIEHNGKTAFLTEYLNKGLTDRVEVFSNNEQNNFNRVYDAELYVNTLLR